MGNDFFGFRVFRQSQQRLAAAAFQRALRSRFQARLKAGVRVYRDKPAQLECIGRGVAFLLFPKGDEEAGGKDP
jgi:hypothetical protein